MIDRVPAGMLSGEATLQTEIGRPAVAESLLARLESACVRCEHYYEYEAVAARSRGDTAIADTLLARARRSVAARHDR